MNAQTKPGLDLAGLQTEARNLQSANIDQVSTVELCRVINREDASIAKVVEGCIPVISEVIDALTSRVRRGGRVISIGAGTSGRLGVLDASEIPPTYSAPKGQFIGLIAGGDQALRNAIEGAEDDTEAAVKDLSILQLDPEVDSIIGVASSGRTPYVLSGLRRAKSLGCVTIGIACAHPSAMETEGNADFMISAVTGPEVVTGSTRMKAGTATKMILNMISTGVMIKIGKTFGNMMIDLHASNLKLRQRAKNILRFIGGPLCPEADEELEAILTMCNGSVKLAAATIILQQPVSQAKESLERHLGVLAKVVEEARASVSASEIPASSIARPVVCIDAGGSGCKAVILDDSGRTGTGESGPCNVSNVGVDVAASVISAALSRALVSYGLSTGQPADNVLFSKALVGLAGYDRPSVQAAVRNALLPFIQVAQEEDLRIATDIDLLPMTLTKSLTINSAIVLVAGTGSVAMSYQRQSETFVRTARIGGWGRMLGDEGSGYYLGREGLRVALASSDAIRLQKAMGKAAAPPDDLSPVIFDYFAKKYPAFKEMDLLSFVLVPTVEVHNGHDVTAETTRRIAEIAPVVIEASGSSSTARAILERGAESLARLVACLLSEQNMDTSRTALILSGGLMKNEIYRQMVMDCLSHINGVNFDHVELVEQPALAAAESLLANY